MKDISIFDSVLQHSYITSAPRLVWTDKETSTDQPSVLAVRRFMTTPKARWVFFFLCLACFERLLPPLLQKRRLLVPVGAVLLCIRVSDLSGSQEWEKKKKSVLRQCDLLKHATHEKKSLFSSSSLAFVSTLPSISHPFCWFLQISVQPDCTWPTLALNSPAVAEN